MADPFIEALTRHKPVTVTQSLVSCACETPGLLFDGWVEWAEHVAEELRADSLIVPRSEIVGTEYGWRFAEPGFDPQTYRVSDGRDAAIAEAAHIRRIQRGKGQEPNAVSLSRPILPWSVDPLPEAVTPDA